jgi:hypothetical protein
MKHWKVFAAAVLLIVLGPRDGEAGKVAGVEIPDSAVVAQKNLTLNGAGIRKKFVVKVYVGAIYLQERRGESEEVLGLPGPKRMTMHFLHDEVGVDKITGGWIKGFESNNTGEEMARLKERLDVFNGLFKTAHGGDIYHLDLVPGEGTVVSLNGKRLGAVPGEDFYTALLKVWIGSRPADGNLKKGLLGK